MGKSRPDSLLDVLLEAPHDGLHLVGTGRSISRSTPQSLPLLLENLLERLPGQIEDHDAVHLHETPVRVPGELRIAALASQPLDGDIVEAEVEDRLHHPRHGHRGAGPHRDQQRIVSIAEVLARRGLDAMQGILHLMLEALGELVRSRGRPGR